MESTAALPTIAEGEEEEEEEQGDQEDQDVIISRHDLCRLLIAIGASAESSNMVDIMFPRQDPISLSRLEMNVLAVGRPAPVDIALWIGIIQLFGVEIIDEEDEAQNEEEPLAVTWRCLADGRWASGPVLNPEEETGVSVTASGWAEPLSVSAGRVEQVAQEAATKMQGAWRAFISRVL
jgi:hypothetical protein